MAGIEITDESRPQPAPGVRLQFDEARKTWVLMAPERVFMLDDVAAEVLKRCDGRSFADLLADLGEAFSATRADIEDDVRDMLTGMIEKGAMDP